jgi:monoamine oxidase
VIWYPSDRFQAPRQVLLAAYTATPAGARAFAARPIAQQIALARAAVDKVHPGHGRDLSAPVVINWGKQPFSLGPWIEWGQDGNDPATLDRLNQGDGPFVFAGSHLSAYSGHWQEGAVLSARHAVGLLSPHASQGE